MFPALTQILEHSLSRRLYFVSLPLKPGAFLFRAVPPEVQSLRAFTTELVVEAVVRCLRVINPDVGSGLSHLLPPAMSARFRLAMSLAQACMVSALLPVCTLSSFLFHKVTKFFSVPQHSLMVKASSSVAKLCDELILFVLGLPLAHTF